jgi:hypothetical protein
MTKSSATAPLRPGTAPVNIDDLVAIDVHAHAEVPITVNAGSGW